MYLTCYVRAHEKPGVCQCQRRCTLVRTIRTLQSLLLQILTSDIDVYRQQVAAAKHVAVVGGRHILTSNVFSALFPKRQIYRCWLNLKPRKLYFLDQEHSCHR